MTDPDNRRTFLLAQGVDTLADLLLELAARHEPVQERLERWSSC